MMTYIAECIYVCPGVSTKTFQNMNNHRRTIVNCIKELLCVKRSDFYVYCNLSSFSIQLLVFRFNFLIQGEDLHRAKAIPVVQSS